MKTLYLTLICVFFYEAAIAQNQPSKQPSYKRIPTVPPFTLALASDSSLFTKENLRKKKSIIIMVFSPDCDHCIHATEDLLSNIQLFKNTQIILTSSLSYESVQKFYKDFNLVAYTNIYVGYDSKRFLSSFYEVVSFPSIYLYDKKGKFKKAFFDHPDFKNIAVFL